MDNETGWRAASGIRWICLILCACLWVGAGLCYTFRFDTCAVVTAYPAWVWAVPGLLAILLARLPGRGRWCRIGLSLAWVVFILLFAEEPKSIARWCLHPVTATQVESSPNANTSLRIVCLNCACGNLNAALETAAFRPDIVLLQEVPARDRMSGLSRELFGECGSYVWGVDTAILVRGEISASIVSGEFAMHMVQGRARLDSGPELEIASIRLVPPPLRFDLWSLKCWRTYADERRCKRSEIAQIKSQLDALPHGTPILIGGDFNMPSGDAALDGMPSYLHDAFDEAGLGWGNTMTNGMPVVRFDQIWVSSDFQAVAVTAHKTKHSDHRMVVCDIVKSAVGN